jgi:hypothetical protein
MGAETIRCPTTKASSGHPPGSGIRRSKARVHWKVSILSYAFLHGQGRGLLRRRMKEDKTAPKLTFIILRETSAICRLDKDAPIPDWVFQGGLFSVTRTKDELSIVCPQINVPKGIVCNQGWSCLKLIFYSCKNNSLLLQ